MRYRAFLSYSHADEHSARGLHRRLETYRLPDGLEPTVDVEGLDVRRLTPVFRDRDELVAASDLASEIRVALASSAALIVVASPASARSRYVNQEIEEFLALPGQRPVFVYVVDGDPGATAEDPRSCVPPALRAGTSTEPIAADARPGKDGRTLAFLKIAAPLFGVGLGVLRDREARRRQRRLLALSGVAAILVVLLAGLATLAVVNAGRAESNANLAQQRAKEARQQERRAREEEAAARQALARFQIERGRQHLLNDRVLRAVPYLEAGRTDAADPGLADFLLEDAAQRLQRFLFEVGPLPAAVADARVSPDGARLVVGTTDGTHHVFGLPQGRLLGRYVPCLFHGTDSAPCVDRDAAVAAGLVGTALAGGDSHGYVTRIGEPTAARELLDPDGHRASLVWLSLDPTGTWVVGRPNGGRQAWVWPVADANPPRLLEGTLDFDLKECTWSADGRRLVVVADARRRNGTPTTAVALVDPEGARVRVTHDLTCEDRTVRTLVDPNGAWWLLAWATLDGRVHLALHDLESGEDRQRRGAGVTSESQPQLRLRLAPGGSRVLFHGEDFAVCYDLTDEGLVPVPMSWEPGAHHRIQDLAWAPDGKGLYVRRYGEAAVHVDLTTGEVRRAAPGQAERMLVGSHPPRLVLQRDRVHLEVLELDGRQGERFAAHGDPISHLGVDAEHGVLLTAAHDGYLRGWDLESAVDLEGAQRLDLEAEFRATFPEEIWGRIPPPRMAISPDGRVVAWISHRYVDEDRLETEVVAVDTARLEEVGRFGSADRFFQSLFVTDGGERIVATTTPGQGMSLGNTPIRVHVYDVDAGRLAEPLQVPPTATGFLPLLHGLSSDGAAALVQQSLSRAQRLDLESGEIATLKTFDAPARMAVSRDGSLVLVSSPDDVTAWALDGSARVMKLLVRHERTGSAPPGVWLADDGHAAFLVIDGIAYVLDANAATLHTLTPQPTSARAISLPAGAGEILVGMDDGTIVSHAVASGERTRALPRAASLRERRSNLLPHHMYGVGHAPQAVALTGNGALLVVVTRDRTVHVRDASTGEMLRVFGLDPNAMDELMTTIETPPVGLLLRRDDRDLLVLDGTQGVVSRHRLRAPDAHVRRVLENVAPRLPYRLEGGRLVRER